MHPTSDFSSSLPPPPSGQRASLLSWFAATVTPAPAGEAPLMLPSDWDLLEPDQRVRTIGEW